MRLLGQNQVPSQDPDWVIPYGAKVAPTRAPDLRSAPKGSACLGSEFSDPAHRLLGVQPTARQKRSAPAEKNEKPLTMEEGKKSQFGINPLVPLVQTPYRGLSKPIWSSFQLRNSSLPPAPGHEFCLTTLHLLNIFPPRVGLKRNSSRLQTLKNIKKQI